MHDIWNPWHGCVKCSEGCDNWYMYFLDRVRGLCGSDIFRTKEGFDYPLKFFPGGSGRVEGRSLGYHMAEKRCEVFSADEASRTRRAVSSQGLGRRLAQCLLQCDLRKSAESGREDSDPSVAAFSA